MESDVSDPTRADPTMAWPTTAPGWMVTTALVTSDAELEDEGDAVTRRDAGDTTDAEPRIESRASVTR